MQRHHEVWVVGQYRGVVDGVAAWDILGIMSSQDAAEEVCKGYLDRFVGPFTVDVVLPDEVLVWPGCYYPETQPRT